MKIPWACPKCGALPNEHGRGVCDTGTRRVICEGFLCDCMEDTDEDHGDSFANPCPNAICYHCGWGGTFPVKPKNLQAWEKKALEAGWLPPEARKKELGL